METVQACSYEYRLQNRLSGLKSVSYLLAGLPWESNCFEQWFGILIGCHCPEWIEAWEKLEAVKLRRRLWWEASSEPWGMCSGCGKKTHRKEALNQENLMGYIWETGLGKDSSLVLISVLESSCGGGMCVWWGGSQEWAASSFSWSPLGDGTICTFNFLFPSLILWMVCRSSEKLRSSPEWYSKWQSSDEIPGHFNFQSLESYPGSGQEIGKSLRGEQVLVRRQSLNYRSIIQISK